MNFITRRNFIKTTALAGASLLGGKYLVSGGPTFKKLLENPVYAVEGGGVTTVVSDVDAHSQCMMNAYVSNHKLVRIKGNPLDPEGKGTLTERGKYMKEILYAPDRLKYPMKRAGEKGEGKWQRITWNEALDIMSRRLKQIKAEHGAEAIHFMHGHYHSGDILGSYLPPAGQPDRHTQRLEPQPYLPPAPCLSAIRL